MRIRTLALAAAAVAACSKPQPADDTKWADPVGIDLAGQDLMAAIAAEAGHDLDAAAIPDLAMALSGAGKACPGVATLGANVLTIRLSVKGGALAAPADAKAAPLGACVAAALDGKPVRKLADGKLMIQLGPKERK